MLETIPRYEIDVHQEEEMLVVTDRTEDAETEFYFASSDRVEITEAACKEIFHGHLWNTRPTSMRECRLCGRTEVKKERWEKIQ